jgi:hypothetical protein
VALVLGPGTGPSIEAQMVRAEVTPMRDAALERVRHGIPAARVLSLLECLARGESGRVVLDYVEGLALALDVRP